MEEWLSLGKKYIHIRHRCGVPFRYTERNRYLWTLPAAFRTSYWHGRFKLSSHRGGSADPCLDRSPVALVTISPVNRRHVVYLGGAVIAGVAVGHLVRRTAPIGREIESSVASPILTDPGSPTSDAAAASVRMAVFTDYRCPACRRAFPAMEEAVRVDGYVRTVYKDWPIFGPLSERAARVAVASVEQGIYPSLHRRLMTEGRAITDMVLREAVTEAGGDWKRLTAYLALNHDSVTARLRLNGVQALSLGLPGTPGFLAGSTLMVGGIDERDFARLFALARVQS